jgi:hypothetical protein
LALDFQRIWAQNDRTGKNEIGENSRSMAGPTDQQTSPVDATPVPDLIERYRLRRDAWIAQADELARLRDEVRGSAEREAMEIVTAARRDVRKVIMEARRELLVLSAQVQAALGEVAAQTDPAALLTKAGITSDTNLPALGPGKLPPAAEDAVNEILTEVHDDMAALAEDAKALPLQVVPPVRQIGPPPSPPTPVVIESQMPRTPAAITAPSQAWPTASPTPPAHEEARPEERLQLKDAPALTDSASRVLLSSQFPGDAVPVPGGKRVTSVVALWAAAGIAVVSIAVWSFAGRGSVPAKAGAASAGPAIAQRPVDAPLTEQTPPANTPAKTPVTSSAKTPATAPARANGNLSIVAEALRDVWVRTTIDGRTDDGRTLAAGQVIDVSAEQSISLRVGDAGAIAVSVNHGEKRPLGRDGQVVTRQFVVEGAKPAPNEAAPIPAPNPPKPQPPSSAPPAPPIASAAPPAAAPPPSIAKPVPVIASPVQSASAPPAPTPVPAAPAPTNQLLSTASQPPASAPAVTQLSAPAPPATAANANSQATVVVAAARQWLDAYHRQDRAALAALSTDNLLLADERRLDERFAPGSADVTRSLDRVSVQIAADTAVLTAVMTETSATAPPHVSPISQVWVLGSGQWKVRQARFVSQARLNQAFVK